MKIKNFLAHFHRKLRTLKNAQMPKAKNSWASTELSASYKKKECNRKKFQLFWMSLCSWHTGQIETTQTEKNIANLPFRNLYLVQYLVESPWKKVTLPLPQWALQKCNATFVQVLLQAKKVSMYYTITKTIKLIKSIE